MACHPGWWSTWWCRAHSRTRLASSVGPPWVTHTTWVALAPHRGPVTAREAAVLVTDDQGVPQRSGDGPGCGAVVEDGRTARHDHPVHGAVAEQPGEGGTVERRPVDDVAAAAGLQVLELDHHVDVRAVTTAGVGLLVIEEEPADVDEGVRPPGGRGRHQVGPVRSGQPQRGRHDGATFSIERAIENPAVVEGAREVQRALRTLGSVGSGRLRASQYPMARLTPATVMGIR